MIAREGLAPEPEPGFGEGVEGYAEATRLQYSGGLPEEGGEIQVFEAE